MKDWFIRYSLGLHCRSEDKKQIEAALPEIFAPNFLKSGKNARHFVPYFWDYIEIKDLIDWANVEEHEPNDSSSYCKNCPINETGKNPDSQDSKFFNLEIAGGVGRAGSLKAFLQLVNKTQKNSCKHPIKDVYITDRYFLADEGETGEGGGYSSMLSYLDHLGLSESDSFSIYLPSWPSKSKKQKERGDDLTEAQKIFERLIRERFINVEFDRLPQQPKFHDRLYLVRDAESKISGVFGPSLNGLSGSDIALMGQIDDQQVLDKLDRIISP